MILLRCLSVLLFLSLVGCSPFTTEPRPGPDKQSVGTWYGAASGAGAGMVTGFQTGASLGPAAWIGAAFGGFFGMLSGLGVDLQEEDQLRRRAEIQRIRETAWAQQFLAEHYARRMELHPGRDIFPADVFFVNDSAELRPGAPVLIRGIADMTYKRMPWSRIVIAAYNTSSTPDSTFAEWVTKQRAETIALYLVQQGVEPRRILTQNLTVPNPILVDPEDDASRYRQAIEFVPLDY